MSKGNKREKYRYTRATFTDIVCGKCGLCSPDVPCFCYNMYKKAPDDFFKSTYKQLRNIKKWPSKRSRSKKEFEKIFCSLQACGKKKKKNCKTIASCMDSFYPAVMSQIQEGRGISNTAGNGLLKIKGRLRKNKKSKRKKKKQYIVESKPTFFCSDNKEWKEEVEEALHGESIIKEQDYSI